MKFFAFKAIILMIFCCLLENGQAQVLRLELSEIRTENHKLLGYIYQQPFSMENDPVGDLLLLETVKKLPRSILGHLTGNYKKFLGDRNAIYKELNQQFPFHSRILSEEATYDFINLDEVEASLRIAIEGTKRPFNLTKIKRMFTQVIAEEFHKGIIPKYGLPHDWSSEFLKSHRGKYVAYKRFSKIFLCLVRGVCSRFIVSGKEGELESFIMSQPQNSITLDVLFRKSFQISHGDVYITLLTIENILSRYWQTPNRENLAITKRLKPFTNYHYRTDTFGQWYHLFGIMLYGYVKNGMRATIAGNVESAGSLVLSGFRPERQENKINSLGGRIGAHLKRVIKQKKYETFKMNSEYLDEAYYRIFQDMSKKVQRKNKKKSKKEGRDEN